MDKAAHEENLSQKLHTNNTQSELAVANLRAYTGLFSGNFHVTNKNKSFHFTTSIADGDFSESTNSPGIFERENSKEETRGLITEDHFTVEDYPFLFEAKISSLGSFIQRSPGRGIQFSFLQDDSIWGPLGFKQVEIYGNFILSDNPVGKISFHIFFFPKPISLT